MYMDLRCMCWGSVSAISRDLEAPALITNYRIMTKGHSCLYSGPQSVQVTRYIVSFVWPSQNKTCKGQRSATRQSHGRSQHGTNHKGRRGVDFHWQLTQSLVAPHFTIHHAWPLQVFLGLGNRLL